MDDAADIGVLPVDGQVHREPRRGFDVALDDGAVRANDRDVRGLDLLVGDPRGTDGDVVLVEAGARVAAGPGRQSVRK